MRRGGGFRRRSTLHHAVKNKRVTVQDPVKKPQMGYMSQGGRGGGAGKTSGGGGAGWGKMGGKWGR